jgi:hypothetical protein
MTGLVGQERLLGCRIEAAANTGAIPGIHIGAYHKINKHSAFRKRSSSFCSFDRKGTYFKPLKRHAHEAVVEQKKKNRE